MYKIVGKWLKNRCKVVKMGLSRGGQGLNVTGGWSGSWGASADEWDAWRAVVRCWAEGVSRGRPVGKHGRRVRRAHQVVSVRARTGGDF